LGGELLERLTRAGLDLGVSPTRTRPGGARIAQNCWIPSNGAIQRRPGYRRWMELGLGAPVRMLVQLGNKVLFVAGIVDEEGDESC